MVLDRMEVMEVVSEVLMEQRVSCLVHAFRAKMQIQAVLLQAVVKAVTIPNIKYLRALGC